MSTDFKDEGPALDTCRASLSAALLASEDGLEHAVIRRC
jgi:hypothetical protein